jgi:hypothetical protein
MDFVFLLYFLFSTERVRLMLSGNLHVINVSSADQGQYSCTAANHITGELIDGQRVLKLVVKGAPVRTKAATITWQPEERYISQIGMLLLYHRLFSLYIRVIIYFIFIFLLCLWFD